MPTNSMFLSKYVNRQAPALLLIGVAIAYFTLTRIGLMIYSLDEADLTLGAALRIFTTGLVYDLAFCVYAALPASLWFCLVPRRLWTTRFHRFLVHALIFAGIFSLGMLAVSESLFWEEFEVRFNFISVDYLIYTQEVTENIWESYSIPLILALNLVLSAAVYRLIRPLLTRALSQPTPLRPRFVGLLALGICALASSSFLGQGMRQSYTNGYQREFGSNGPYQFVAAFRNNEIEFERFYATQPAAESFSQLRKAVAEPNSTFVSEEPTGIRRTVSNPAGTKDLNLMLIMVESLSADFMARYGNEGNLTPVLDGLMEQSIVFDQLYATGTRTTRGLEAVTLSLPPTPGRSIVKRIGRETGMDSLGQILGDQGYDVRFLYGGRGYFENMSAFFKGNGYTIIDQSCTPADEITFTTAWGMADEDLFRQAVLAADGVADAGEPFFFHIMTTSNHRPYLYPEGRIDIPSGSGRHGAVKYTDWAIGEFIEQARSHPWFDDTVFVVVADHCASSAGKVDLPVERYHIPMLIYSPSNVDAAVVDTLTSQIDIAPTLLALLGVSYTASFFGKDVLALGDSEHRALIANYQHLGLFQDGLITILQPRKRIIQRAVGTGEEPQLTEEQAQSLVAETISYYQGASSLYAHRLDGPPPAPDAAR